METTVRLEWEKHKSKSRPGLFYYFNRKTGETVWTDPESSGGAKANNLLKLKPSSGISKNKNLAQNRLNVFRENLEKKRQLSEELKVPIFKQNQNLTKICNPTPRIKNENQSKATSNKLNTVPNKEKNHTIQTSTDMKSNKSVQDRLENKTLKNSGKSSKQLAASAIKNNEKIVQNKVKFRLQEEKAKPQNSEKLHKTTESITKIRSTEKEVRSNENKPNKERNWLTKAVASAIGYASNKIKEKCNIKNVEKKPEKSKLQADGSITPSEKSVYKNLSESFPTVSEANFNNNKFEARTQQSKTVKDCKKENTNLYTKVPRISKEIDIKYTKSSPPSYMTEFYKLIAECNKPQSANERLSKLRNVIGTKNSNGKTQATSTAPAANTSEEDENMMTDDESDVEEQPGHSNNDVVTPMDWEDIDEHITTQIKEIREFGIEQSAQTIGKSYNIIEENLLKLSSDINANQLSIKNNKFYIVIDTNIFLGNLALPFLDKLAKLKFRGSMQAVLIVPYTVLQELDKLKHRKYSYVSRIAAKAIIYINKKFSELNEYFKGQSAYEAKRHLINIESSDDSILNCCLQIKQCTDKLVLLSNDTNLRNKSMCNNIHGCTKNDLLYKSVQ